MPRALISVSDKRGIVDFARGLGDLGWDLVSTGGTAAALQRAGLPVTTVDAITGFPEILDGRVKTLHPAIHAGLLACVDNPNHVQTLADHGLPLFDLVAVNLYPFQATVANPAVTFENAIENIDVGGPTMLRAAAKNHTRVVPVVNPVDYPLILEMLRKGDIPPECRRELAAKVFTHVADYDAAIARYLTVHADGLPPRLNLSLERKQTLRYGENPSQRAALYVSEEPRGFGDMRQLQGKELSFNNLLDMDAAVQVLTAWPHAPACVIVKHTTPCGVATGRTALEALTRARETDPVSSFGSVIGLNTAVDRPVAEALDDLFVEVVVAPSVSGEAREVFRRVQRHPPGARTTSPRDRGGPDEPRRRHLPGGSQGPGGETPSRRSRAGLRRVLPLPRRGRGGRGSRDQGLHPAWWFHPRCGRDRGGGPPRDGDGVHRRPPIPSLDHTTTLFETSP